MYLGLVYVHSQDVVRILTSALELGSACCPQVVKGPIESLLCQGYFVNCYGKE